MVEGSLRVDNYQEAVKAAFDFSRLAGNGFILRLQDKKETMINVNNGETEEIVTTSLKGAGAQVITRDGYIGFASSDRIDPQAVKEMMTQAIKLAGMAREVKGEQNLALFGLAPNRRRKVLQLKYAYGSVSLSEMEERLLMINKKVSSGYAGLSVRTILRVVDEEWRIARQDGTDTSFMTPRAFIYNIFTAKDKSGTATTYSNIPGSDLSILMEPAIVSKLIKRSVHAAQMATDLLTAETVKGGAYKLVIDYALAKGLAHEAFGHAAETDGMDSSILGKAGRMRIGEKVASEKVSIIDGPVEGDYSYQPISANGIDRQTVYIVKDGILQAGLADLFSAAKAGVEVTGAGRVETCHHLPLARMSNIRIEMKAPLPVKEEFEEITPEKLYLLLVKEGLMTEEEEVLYLSGFQGGQVNPAQGDFVFNCSGIYKLGPNPVLYRPAIFSGSILSALESILAGIGPLRIDAMGTCGKMFQGVPSSGGSHYFLVLDKNPEIIIGGETGE